MKRFHAVMAGLLLALATTFTHAVEPPTFPGLPDLGAELLGPEISQEEIAEQKKYREELEAFAKQLKAWWYAQNNPRPIPYVEFKGKKVALPESFLKAYMRVLKSGELKETWPKIEASFKKGSMFKARSKK